MKKLIALILVLALSCAVLSALAEDALTDIHCEEMQFTTKIPASAAARYEENTGLVIYTKREGSIPYVVVKRRTPEQKFKNPENYLNNVYREYMENSMGDKYIGMIGVARTQTIGGRDLLCTRYEYYVSNVEVTLLVALDIRDAGDVEFYAKFYDGNEEITMAALEEAVRNYQEDSAE